MNKLIEKSETSQSRIVFPGDLNDHDTLFGGKAMQWMDEVAYITAIRYARKTMVTVTINEVHFISPIKSGSIVQINGRIVEVGNVKVLIGVDMYCEEMITGKREKAINAMFTFAAVNHENKPVRIK